MRYFWPFLIPLIRASTGDEELMVFHCLSFSYFCGILLFELVTVKTSLIGDIDRKYLAKKT
jgi:hypothetical protein